MTISWQSVTITGGWDVTNYLIWVDDGHGNWPSSPITVPITYFTNSYYL